MYTTLCILPSETRRACENNRPGGSHIPAPPVSLERLFVWGSAVLPVLFLADADRPIIATHLESEETKPSLVAVSVRIKKTQSFVLF